MKPKLKKAAQAEVTKMLKEHGWVQGRDGSWQRKVSDPVDAVENVIKNGMRLSKRERSR
jgi:hypothetical protein